MEWFTYNYKVKTPCAFLMAILFINLWQANGQDTICTRENYCFAAKIISVERKEIWFKSLTEDNGILQHFRNENLLKIRFQNGEEKYYISFLRQASLGISIYSNFSPARSYDIGKYAGAGNVSFLSTGILISGYYRGNIMGILLSTGYTYKTICRQESYQYTTYQNSYHNLSQTIEAASIPFYVTPRVNLGKKKFKAFFDLTMGTEFFQNGTAETNPSLKNPFICKTGAGIQAKEFQHWNIEFKVGLGTRPDYKSNTGKNFLTGNFELSFYRILYSKITH